MISDAETDVRAKQSIRASNRWLTRTAYCFAGFGAALPFFLPQSSWLAESKPVQLMVHWVPAAIKASTVATHANVVLAYVALMFTAAPLLAIYGLLHHTAWPARGRSYQERSGSALSKLVRSLAGAMLFASLNLLFYQLPGSVSVSTRGGHGQFLFAAMVSSLPGLAVVGGLLSAAIFAIWWVTLVALILPILQTFNLETRSDSNE